MSMILKKLIDLSEDKKQYPKVGVSDLFLLPLGKFQV